MRHPPRDRVFQVALAAFEALIPSLIEFGITSPEAEKLLRAVYVHQTALLTTKNGRPNVSQVSIRSGIDRHTVAALLRSPDSLERRDVGDRRTLNRVVQAWTMDPLYTNRRRPVELPLGGPNYRGRSLWQLISNTVPGTWPRLIVDELLRLGLVARRPHDMFRCMANRSSVRFGKRPRGANKTNREMRDALRAYINYVAAQLNSGSPQSTEAPLKHIYDAASQRIR